jgi:APA family basic amino acid/polyamine antiporter
MDYLPWMTWIRFLVWSAIGVLVYFGYSVKHSRLNGETPTVPASGK